MKFKRTVLLATFVVTMGLLLGASATQAATVIKVVGKGDTLPDGTILTGLNVDGAVAINLDGKVAFEGKDDDGTDAAFTQDGKVVAEGDPLPDDTILSWFRKRGKVAISAGQSGDKVAFHGIANTGATYTAAVFTQDGVVAAVGDTLAEGTLNQINDSGKVAINNWDEVAFHGSVKIESGSEDFRAVFISDGLDTLVVAREDTNLPDETSLVNITESGGVAINDRGVVAFHGQTVDPVSGGLRLLPAVFTQNRLVAKVGDILDDGTTDGATLEHIPDNGGVAINLLGQVAFIGFVSATESEVLELAVLTENGVVAKNGDTLPDGSFISNIEVSAGVAINLFGDVVFQGRTGGVKAVFTQNGLVAKVGDLLEDGTTFWDIYDWPGVAINPYGSEVAFLGAGIPDTAVFLGQAPLPPAP